MSPMVSHTGLKVPMLLKPAKSAGFNRILKSHDGTTRGFFTLPTMPAAASHCEPKETQAGRARRRDNAIGLVEIHLQILLRRLLLFGQSHSSISAGDIVIRQPESSPAQPIAL